MSGRGDRREHSGRDRGDRRDLVGRDRGDRRRSRSPRDRRENRYNERDYPHRQDSHFASRGGYDHPEDRQRGRESATNPPSGVFPTPVEIPSTGRKFIPPPIPIEGTMGRRTRVAVNHFMIQSLPVVKIFAYGLLFRVPESSQRRGSSKVTPTQLDKVMRHEAVKLFLGRDFVFDGNASGWSTTQLMATNTQSVTTVDLDGSTSEKPNQVEVVVRATGALHIKALVDYMSGGKIDLDPMGNRTIEPLLKWLNSVYRQDPASRWVTRPNASAYYDRAEGTYQSLRSTANVLEAVRGIYQTVQIRFGKLTVNVDTATTAFWAPQKNFIELACALTGVRTSDELQSRYLQNPQHFFELCNRIVGIFFNVRHLGENKLLRKIKFAKWTRGNAFESEFERSRDAQAPQKTNVFQYYQSKYNIQLRYPKLPLVDTKDGMFPMELCWSASGERYKEVLQGAETADFIKFATAPASTRRLQIMENVKKLQWHKLDPPKTMGLSVSPQMLTVDARVLPPPLPKYEGNTSDHRPPEAGRWNLRGKRFLQPKSVRSWALLYFPAGGSGPSDGNLQQFGSSIQQALRGLGMSVPQRSPVVMRGNPSGNMSTIIAELMAKGHSLFAEEPQLLLFLLQGASEHLYRGIKHLCDIQFGVASQVMLIDKAMSPRGQMQYLANIAAKVNVKLGGLNSNIDEDLFKKSRWMVFGGDTSHPSPAQLKLNPPPPTYSALSGSWDKGCAAYTSVASAQFSKEQTISDFEHMFKELLLRYQERNGGLTPQSIIYYRDGLSESQISQIMAEEVEPLKELRKKLPDLRAKITVVLCIKRHHTRMFPIQSERTDKLGNALPGTVIENSGGKDIYLVAHPGLQGTVRPTRYVVLIDENDLSANDFQRLTNNICYSYARATTAVSVVPPVYYADQACERAKLHLRPAANDKDKDILGEVHRNLKYSMYWQ